MARLRPTAADDEDETTQNITTKKKKKENREKALTIELNGIHIMDHAQNVPSWRTLFSLDAHDAYIVMS